MDKYYTPEIEEFHIGFEYEWLNEDGIWIKESSPTEISEKDFDEQTYGLRVKYLDKEDIEGLGFKQDYERTSLTTSKHYQNKFYSLTYNHDNNVLIIKIKDILDVNSGNYNMRIIFQGNIKNKSELNKLLKQLNINEN